MLCTLTAPREKEVQHCRDEIRSMHVYRSGLARSAAGRNSHDARHFSTVVYLQGSVSYQRSIYWACVWYLGVRSVLFVYSSTAG